MTAEPDDDALSWAGDKDVAPPDASPLDSAAPRDATFTQTGTATKAATAPATTASSFSLIAMGVLAGIYLLYTIGWFIGVTRIGNPLPDPVAQFMFSFGSWLAVAAPVIWFAATYWLTEASLRLRFVWLLIGVVVLAPLPFIVGTGGIS